MTEKAAGVYQLKITLNGVAPVIWRRILVPETYTFWDLHVAIQDAMGWTDSHLHQFEVIDPATGTKQNIGIPDEDFGGDVQVLAGWEEKIADYFSMDSSRVDYLYDFGDNWLHEVGLEEILPQEADVNYPACIAGERACPPEDCGGVFGYEDFLEAITDPGHKEHEDVVEWAGGEFNPEIFDFKEVSFDNPKKRWKLAFE